MTNELIIHKDIAGDHVTDGEKCWCEPLIIDEDTLLTTEQIIVLSDIKDLKQ